MLLDRLLTLVGAVPQSAPVVAAAAVVAEAEEETESSTAPIRLSITDISQMATAAKYKQAEAKGIRR